MTHRDEPRGVGGIFKDFEFTKNVEKSFLKIYPDIVKRHYDRLWSEKDVVHQLKKRA